MNSRDDFRFLCIGEILWDELPDGLYLGGAPYNVAVHLRQLGREVDLISRVGKDEPGRQALEEVQKAGLNQAYIQQDFRYPTGIVKIKLDDQGNAVYDIGAPAAWDFLESDKELISLAQKSDIFIYGSLAQRSPRSRQTIRALLPYSKMNVFDMNLREPYYDWDTIKELLEGADLIKLNEQELQKLARWQGWPKDDPGRSVTNLAEKFNCASICLTRGERGVLLYDQGIRAEHPGFAVSVVDSVGAGDAFLAGLLHALMNHETPQSALTLANALGAFVVGQKGATPVLNMQFIRRLTNRDKI